VADWIGDAGAALAAGPAALVTILATEGSAPRGAGTRMVVTPDALHGTIGGGALEWRVTEQAQAILARPEGAWRVQDYPLGPLLGQCCGGRVRLLVERLETSPGWLAAGDGAMVATLHADRVERTLGAGAEPASARGPLPSVGARFLEMDDRPRRRVLLFGAGHVGRAIARLMPGLPLTLGWFDSRAETAALPGVVREDEDALIVCAAAARADDAVIVLTHDHGLDYRLTAAALGSPARFVGLIGSATKRARFTARLAAEGIDSARLTCPIGAEGIAGKEPAVIAIAAVAQLLALR
jgi:xanthine dehydrogenase accessory factor